MARVLGLIPARGGSKGLPGKHLKRLHGAPLLAYTCRAARRARTLSRTVLSSDDRAIIACARRYGIDAPFVRPKALARDHTRMVQVVRHAVATLRRLEGYEPDVIVLLQPTSPLRRAAHIDAAVTLLTRTGADTVVSVTPVPHRFSPYTVLIRAGNRVRPFWNRPTRFDRFRRQALPVLYARNGPAVLVTRRAVVEQGRLYGRHIVPYLMSEQESVDIDTAWDFTIASAALARRNGKR